MLTLEERARAIGWCTCPMGTGGDTLSGAHGPHCLVTQIADAIRAAVNDKLEEVATEIEKLERGVYTSAQTPAGLVRAMKVK